MESFLKFVPKSYNMKSFFFKKKKLSKKTCNFIWDSEHFVMFYECRQDELNYNKPIIYLLVVFFFLLPYFFYPCYVLENSPQYNPMIKLVNLQINSLLSNWHNIIGTNITSTLWDSSNIYQHIINHDCHHHHHLCSQNCLLILWSCETLK